MAQCVGRNDLTWAEKSEYDNIYIDKVKKYGPFYDIKLWFMTLIRVFSMSSIEESEENMKKSKEALKKMVKSKGE